MTDRHEVVVHEFGCCDVPHQVMQQLQPGDFGVSLLDIV